MNTGTGAATVLESRVVLQVGVNRQGLFVRWIRRIEPPRRVEGVAVWVELGIGEDGAVSDVRGLLRHYSLSHKPVIGMDYRSSWQEVSVVDVILIELVRDA